jgi:ubiquinone/menaquinone biosynthesis C-methylase UbiE
MKLNWAERWAVNNPSRPLQQRLEIRWLRKKAQLIPAARVLEIGCGRGAGAYLIKGVFQPEVLHAMDLDTRMIQKAQKYLSPEQREGISFYVGDVIRLPYREGTLDAIFGFGILHHVPDWQKALVEVARVLKPGGVFFMEELYPFLYQNFITKHILLHPRKNRFLSEGLKGALQGLNLHLNNFWEQSKIGILGISIKRTDR